MAKRFVFAYGSMLDVESLGRTLGRSFSPDAVCNAELVDHRRVWGVHVPVIAVETSEHVDAVFLDLRPYSGGSVNGGIVSLRPGDIERLAVREAQYDVIDVTDAIRPTPSAGDVVVTFISRPSFRVARDSVAAAIPAKYRRWIERLARDRGTGFAAAFAASTEPPGVGEFEGAYLFADPAQASAV